VSEGVRVLSELSIDLKGFIEKALNWLTDELMKRLEKIFRPFEKMSQLVANPHNHLEKAKTHAIRKIYTEIDLFDCPYAEGADAEDPGGTHITISGGQVGILQTGAFSTTSMAVHLDSISKQETAKALDTVEKALEEATDVPFDRAEISEMIRESKSELGKPSTEPGSLEVIDAGRRYQHTDGSVAQTGIRRHQRRAGPRRGDAALDQTSASPH
jgi:hypothetical protein